MYQAPKLNWGSLEFSVVQLYGALVFQFIHVTAHKFSGVLPEEGIVVKNGIRVLATKDHTPTLVYDEAGIIQRVYIPLDGIYRQHKIALVSTADPDRQISRIIGALGEAHHLVEKHWEQKRKEDFERRNAQAVQ